MPLGGTQGDGVGLGPLQVQVRRVLPGEADPAVQLHALLRRPYREPTGVNPASRASTAQSASCAGTNRMSAASASATPVKVTGGGAPGGVANGSTSTAVVCPAATAGSRSSSPAASSAAVAIAAPRY